MRVLVWGVVALALPALDSPTGFGRMSDAELASYHSLCDWRVPQLLSEGDEVRARWFAFARAAIESEQAKRMATHHGL